MPEVAERLLESCGQPLPIDGARIKSQLENRHHLSGPGYADAGRAARCRTEMYKAKASGKRDSRFSISAAYEV